MSAIYTRRVGIWLAFASIATWAAGIAWGDWKNGSTIAALSLIFGVISGAFGIAYTLIPETMRGIDAERLRDITRYGRRSRVRVRAEDNLVTVKAVRATGRTILFPLVSMGNKQIDVRSGTFRADDPEQIERAHAFTAEMREWIAEKPSTATVEAQNLARALNRAGK